MKCPACGFADSKVIDSRHIEEGNSIRRRRECLACQKRYTTFEIVETVQIIVTKKNGTKELFDRNKLLSGLLKACQKRPVNAEEIAAAIETELQNSIVEEISSQDIGEMVLARLKEIDTVSYIRFASVYREFQDIDSFISEINNLEKRAGRRKIKKKEEKND